MDHEKTPETGNPINQHTREAENTAVPQHTVAKPLMQKNMVSRKVQETLIYIYSAISALLVARFIFSLVAARQAAPFVGFVYQLTIPLMIPFENMFGTPLLSNQYKLEFEVLVALAVYAMVFFGIVKLVSIIFDL